MKIGGTNLGSKKSKSRKTKVNDHEQDLADRLGGRRQPASGALPQHKGDIKLDKFLLDSKETEHNSIIVSAEDLTKISREARGEGKHPGLVITIDRVPTTVYNEWVMLPLDVFAEVFEKED